MGYYDARDLPYAWNLADRYVLFDRFFASAQGGSVRNHLFAISATPGNRRADEQPPARLPGHDRRSSTGSRMPASRGGSTSRTTTRQNTIDNPGRQHLAARSGAAARDAARRATRSGCLAHRRHAGNSIRTLARRDGCRPSRTSPRPDRASIRLKSCILGQTFVRSIVNGADAQPGMEQHRIRAHLRQLGRLVRPRARRRPSIATATVSACRRSS